MIIRGLLGFTLCLSHGQLLSIYQQFVTMIRTQFNSSIRGFFVLTDGEYISDVHRRYLAN